MDDLYTLLPDYEAEPLTDKLEKNWFQEVKRNPDKPSLIRATVRTMGWPPFLAGLLLVPQAITKILQAILTIHLLDFFEPCTTMTLPWACGVAGAIVICSLCTSCCYHPYYYTVQMYGLKMRIAYSGLIYRKVLRMSTAAMKSQDSGKITNLIASDAEQIDMATHFFHYLWVAPLELLLASITFWYFVKYISLIAVIYTIILIFAQLAFGELFVRFRTKILTKTDERLKIMSEVLKSMRVVKMYCWTTPFERKINLVRKREIIQCAYRLLLDCVQALLSHTHMVITLLMIYMTMWLLNMRFDTRLFTVLMCIISYMRMWTIDTFNYAVRNLVHYLAARTRIQKFLLLSDCERDKRLQVNHEQDCKLMCNIQMARWEGEASFSLKNIVFDAKPGYLICVIGSVGSGKSSLLQTITGEISHFEGNIQLSGTLCYVPQEAWIFSSTIKDNILFGKDYDHQLFQQIIDITALRPDLEQLGQGLNTVVGDQGATLSGGQKARVNLARALYRNADIYLLDDPLSAVDVKVSKHIFDRSIKRFLGKKICVLVTHHIQFLQDANLIIVLNDGTITEKGTYDELITKPSFCDLVKDIKQHSAEPIKTPDTRCHPLEVTTPEENNSDEAQAMLSEDTRQEGMVKFRTYTSFVRAGVGIVGGLLLPLIFSTHQGLGMFNNWWLASWSEDEGQRHNVHKSCINMSATKDSRVLNMSDIEWKKYRDNRFYIYCGVTIVFVVMTFVRAITTEFMCLNAGRVLHNRMLRRVLRCPIHYFDTTPIGRIMNRFSRDISMVDDALPLTLFEFLQTFFQILGTMALVGYFNPWSFIPAALAFLGMLFVRSRLASCSRDLKRLESVTRTPVYSYLSSSIQGVKVIRSARVEQMCSAKFLSYLNANTCVNYLLFTVNRWSAFRFDWITAGFIASVTFLAIFVRVLQNRLSPVDIALTLSYSLSLMGLLQWSLRLSVETETLMTAPERILEYRSLEEEPSTTAPSQGPPPSDWPSKGEIILRNVSINHSINNQTTPALQQISLSINASEKIGIVGRTGAGKTTLIQTLFRMAPLSEGSVIIDDIDIGTIAVDDLRRKLAVIPQDPVLFTDTIRANLDPFGNYSDAEIWQALEEAQMKTVVNAKMSEGLLSMVSEGGSNLSVGEKQLMCLARAILRKSKILVIDEAMANVDYETDALIQSIIRQKFSSCTVLTIAHRLNTVLDSDRILVLNKGMVVEFDHPQNLLNTTSSEFRSLMDEMSRRKPHDFDDYSDEQL